MLDLAPGSVAPSELGATSTAVDDGTAGRLAEAARRTGRVFERDGLQIAAVGAALRLGGVRTAADARTAQGLLATIQARGGGTRPPIALGALPFDLARPGTLVVPELALVRREGAPPVVVVVSNESDVDHLLATAGHPLDPGPGHSPDQFRLDSVISHDAFRADVARAIEAIGRGDLDKVVLAREVAVSANRPFRQIELVGRLRALHPSCATFAIDGLLGASPELVLRRQGAALSSVPLAGTIARSGDPAEDARLARALIESRKDRAEHRFVVDAIAEVLAGRCGRVEVPDVPHVLELRNVVHLATAITAEDPEDRANALEIALALHPTPAICGTSRPAALAYLAEHERLDRDRYGGLVGYLDAEGDGEWWLAIRSAIVEGASARLMAGVGIVEGSEPGAELAETQLKLQAMLAVLVRP